VNTRLFIAVLSVVGHAALRGAGGTFEETGQIIFIADTSPRRLHIVTKGSPDGYNVWDMTEPAAKCSSGDIVKLRGFQGKPTDAILREQRSRTVCYATNITAVSSARFPETIPATAQEIADPGPQRFVHIDGTVVSVVRDATNAAWNWIIVQTGTGAVRAAATEHDYPYAELLKTLDAEVRIKGMAHRFDAWRRFLGHHVILYGKGGIEVTKPADDPFAAPGLGSNTSHRRQTSGTVVGLSSHRLYIRGESGRFISISPSDPGDMPSPGESVTVSGFVKSGPLGMQLTEAAVRRDGKPLAALEPAEDVDVERLLAAYRDNDIVDASLYGKPVRIQGHVANSAEDIALFGRIMLECRQKNISVDVAHLPQSVRNALETGSTLEVCGICIPEFDADVTNMVFPEFKGLIVIPRTTEDIRVLHTPPWWTPGRLVAVIGALLVMLAWIFSWNRILNRRSERRGRQLYDERVAHVRTEAKVEERTRLAVELHDAISQTLTGVALQVDSAARANGDECNAVGAFLKTSRSMLASCRRELKDCLWDLRSRTFEEKDMTEAIVRTIDPHKGDAAASVRFNVPRERLSESTTRTILSIVRELVVNAIRHGGATRIWIAGEYHDQRITFSVRDNGRGFDAASAPGPLDGHFGLQGVRERVKETGGSVDIASTPGSGTRIDVELNNGELNP